MTDAKHTPSPTHCISCGAEVPDHAKFCHACGAAVYRPEDASQQPEPAEEEFAKTLARASEGDAEAQNKVGKAYYEGVSVSLDYKEAVEWFRRAADQGLDRAQYNLGRAYINGQGVMRDYVPALEWLKKAAEQGLAPAQSYVGAIYFEGLGVDEDLALATEWFQKAAEQGDLIAHCHFGYLYRTGDGGVPQDFAEAANRYRLAAEQNVPLAQYSLACMHFEGNSEVARDEALSWLQRAVEQDYADAQFLLGSFSIKGECVPQDQAQGFSLIQKAAEQGLADAQSFLGTAYREGAFGCPQDDVKAVEWYCLAADQGNGMAQYNLGLMFHDGQGVEQDYMQALMWFKLSSERLAGEQQGSASLSQEIASANLDAVQVVDALEEAFKWNVAHNPSFTPEVRDFMLNTIYGNTKTEDS